MVAGQRASRVSQRRRSSELVRSRRDRGWLDRASGEFPQYTNVSRVVAGWTVSVVRGKCQRSVFDNPDRLAVVVARRRRTITPYLRTPFAETRGRFSPDGKWVAYTSDESGRNDIYVQSFPVGGPKRRISSQGGDFARWRQDGKELFYTAPDNTLMAVLVQAVPNSLTVGEPKPLFKISGRAGSYDVAPDGQHILALPPADDNAASSMTVVVNWPTLLKK